MEPYIIASLFFQTEEALIADGICVVSGGR